MPKYRLKVSKISIRFFDVAAHTFARLCASSQHSCTVPEVREPLPRVFKRRQVQGRIREEPKIQRSETRRHLVLVLGKETKNPASNNAFHLGHGFTFRS